MMSHMLTIADSDVAADESLCDPKQKRQPAVSPTFCHPSAESARLCSCFILSLFHEKNHG